MNYQEVFDSINWEEVKGKILDTFDLRGIADLKIEMVKEDRHGVRMYSNNLAPRLGIFQLALGECYLQFFNRTLSLPGQNDKFWATIQFSYPGNGMTIGSVYISENDGIIVEKDKPRNF